MTPTKNESLPELPLVQRCRHVGGSYPMRDDPNGEYVDYDDHVAITQVYGQQCYEAALTREAPTEGVLECWGVKVAGGEIHSTFLSREKAEAAAASPYPDVAAHIVVPLYSSATPPAPQRLAQGEDVRYVEDGDLLWLSHRLGVIDREYGIHVVKRGGTGDVGDLLSFVTHMRGCNDV